MLRVCSKEKFLRYTDFAWEPYQAAGLAIEKFHLKPNEKEEKEYRFGV